MEALSLIFDDFFLSNIDIITSKKIVTINPILEKVIRRNTEIKNHNINDNKYISFFLFYPQNHQQ